MCKITLAFGIGGMMPPECALNIEGLSDKEWNYVYGLFLTDGHRQSWKDKRSPRSYGYRVVFLLQGDEAEIAHRVAEFLKKAGLHPRIIRSCIKDMIAVRVDSKSLFKFLPDKKTFLKDSKKTKRFFEQNGLFSVDKGVPFIAGLLDGDGTCKAYLDRSQVRRQGCFGKVVVKWHFSQVNYPFLNIFFHSLVESLVSDSSRKIYVNKRLEGVRINRKGQDALLNAGIAKWSWKAATCLESLSVLVEEREKEKARWVKMTEPLGTSLGDVANMMGVSSSYLCRLHRLGRLQTTLVNIGKGRGHFVIPRREAEKLVNHGSNITRGKGHGNRKCDN